MWDTAGEKWPSSEGTALAGEVGFTQSLEINLGLNIKQGHYLLLTAYLYA